MTILEAIQSGKPYKRPAHYEYFQPNELCMLEKEDIIANDWEIRSMKPEIKIQKLTRSEGHIVYLLRLITIVNNTPEVFIWSLEPDLVDDLRGLLSKDIPEIDKV